MNSPIAVSLGEVVVSADPECVMVAYGLGSCLGIGAYDPVCKVAGLLHAVLPINRGDSIPLDSKYVDSGIEGLLVSMVKAGADRKRIFLRMAGGANMLNNAAFTKAFEIGTNNIHSAHQTIERLKIKLTAEEVGGNTGRTVRLYTINGRMTVRVIGGKEQDL
jgi:chemotaxis protein CheD